MKEKEGKIEKKEVNLNHLILITFNIKLHFKKRQTDISVLDGTSLDAPIL